MSTAHPFPILASASNSRSGSPAPAPGSNTSSAAESQPGSGNDENKVNTNKGSVRSSNKDSKQQKSAKVVRHKKNGQQQTESKDGSSASSSVSDGAGKQQQVKESAAAATATATVTPATATGTSNDADPTSNNPQTSTKKPAKKKQKKQKSTAATASPSLSHGEPESAQSMKSPRGRTAQPPSDKNNKQQKKSKNAASKQARKPQNTKNRQQDASAGGKIAASPRSSSSLAVAPPLSAPPIVSASTSLSATQFIKSSSSGSLSMARIVPGENGRARVVFGPTDSNDHQQPMQPHPGFNTAAPRFVPGDMQSRRSSMSQLASGRVRFNTASYGDSSLGLGLSSPISPALSNPSQSATNYYPPANAGYNNIRSVTSPGSAAILQSSSGYAIYGSSGPNIAPPVFRQRSMTSTQLRSTARSFSPQLLGSSNQHRQTQPQQQQQQQQQQQHHHQHQQYQHQHVPIQPRRLSSATSVSLDHMSSLQPPLSAPIQGLVAGARGRSQSVSTHTNMTGLRISMAQSRPGNVLAPHMPALARAASSGSTLQANAYANGGYFASRRASVSNVGLAVDPSHSIRIPTIMFQKQKSDEQVYPSNMKVAVDGTAALITPKSAIEEKAVDDAEKTETKAQDSPAMRRLQEMIESMRKLSSGSVANEDSAAASVATTESTATTSAAALAVAASSASSSRTSSPLASLPSKGTDAASTGIEAPEASSIASMPAITLPPTPAAHPTSRFDSILEEDEDTEDDEAKLDADTGSSSGAVSNVEDDAPTTTATLATANASSANQPSASAVCAL